MKVISEFLPILNSTLLDLPIGVFNLDTNRFCSNDKLNSINYNKNERLESAKGTNNQEVINQTLFIMAQIALYCYPYKSN